MLAKWLVEYTDLDLEGVPRRNLMTLARHLKMRRLKRRGKPVYRRGEPPTHLFVVMDGVAKQDARSAEAAAAAVRCRASRPVSFVFCLSVDFYWGGRAQALEDRWFGSIGSSIGWFYFDWLEFHFDWLVSF